MPKLLQAIPFLAFWFLIGWLIGTFFNRFIARIALWLGIVTLITILLSSLGIVDINTTNINNFFTTLSSWLLKIERVVRDNSFIKADGVAVIFFILGIALSTHQAKRSNVSKVETEAEAEVFE